LLSHKQQHLKSIERRKNYKVLNMTGCEKRLLSVELAALKNKIKTKKN